MENIQNKVNKIGKAGRIVSIVLVVLLSIGALALVLGGIACALLPDAVEVNFAPVVDVKVDKSLMHIGDWELTEEALNEANGKVSEEFGGVTLSKTEDALLVHVDMRDADETSFGIRDALKAIWAGLMAIASAMVTLVMFLQLCKAFEACRTPFDEAVIRRMTIFAWTLIVCAVVSSFAAAVGSAALAGFGKMSFNLSLNPIITALIVFFLCMIFRYGAQLQREADETL